MAETAAKRSYLRGDERRRQLLDAAATVFQRSGPEGLSMVAVAEAAGVSRRLVYDHFADPSEVFNALLRRQVDRYGELADLIHEAAPARNIGAVAIEAFEVLLAMPRRDIAVLRMVLADPDRPDLIPARDHLRTRFAARWWRFVPEGTDPQVARAVIWANVSAAMLYAELVSSGDLSVDQAREIVRSQASYFADVISDVTDRV